MSHSNISDTRYRPIYSNAGTLTTRLPNESESTSSRIKRGKRLACISCRQTKVKCVGLHAGTNCLQCQRKSLKCQVDPQYKRIGQRTKLRELSDEVQHLKSLIANDPNTARADQSQVSGDGQPRELQDDGSTLQDWAQTNTEDSIVQASEDMEDSTFQHSPNIDRNQNHVDHLTEYDDLESATAQVECSSTIDGRQLDGVHVQASEISKLFQIFYQHFHPQMPLVSNAISIDRYHELSPLLFWTILAIASQSDEAEFGLHLRLSKPLTKMLWAKVSTVPMSHFTIQAILLLCTWPYSPASLMSDPASALMSLAKAGCMHLGLHRPESMQDYHRVRFEVQQEQIDEAILLWTCCFITSERVASGEGQDPIFPIEDPVLVRALGPGNQYSLPDGIGQILKIHLIVHQLRLAIISHAGHNVQNSPHHPLLSPLLKTAELQLDSVQLGRSDILQETISIELACARLQVCVMYLEEPVLSSTRPQGLIRACHAATELISLLQHASSQSSFCWSAPRYYGQNLKIAALLLLKLRFSTFSNLLDVDKIDGSYALAISIHNRMNIHHNDFHARAAMLLSDIWKIRLKDNALKSSDSRLTLTSRGSASLLYESQWEWRDHYAARIRAGGTDERPARILPSIILHSPASQRDADSQQEARSRNASNSPAVVSTTTSKRAQQEEVIPLPNSGHSWASVSMSFEGQYSNRLNDQLGEQSQLHQDSQLDPLDLMFAYLNPDEEAAQLFYPQWTTLNGMFFFDVLPLDTLRDQAPLPYQEGIHGMLLIPTNSSGQSDCWVRVGMIYHTTDPERRVLSET